MPSLCVKLGQNMGTVQTQCNSLGQHTYGPFGSCFCFIINESVRKIVISVKDGFNGDQPI